MLDLIEEYGSLIIELIAAIIVFQLIISIVFVSVDETNMLKEIIQNFIATLIGE